MWGSGEEHVTLSLQEDRKSPEDLLNFIIYV